jgi:hypothetical protein
MDSDVKNWKSFQEFIGVANKTCNWLILRNFEYLPNDFFQNDKDVDILCDDIDMFVKIMKLKKRSWGIASYETIIDNKVVPFDVRFLGDGYYDKLWQYKMLENKTYTSDSVPRMNDENYFYSLIYHSKIQKTEVKEAYKKRFYDLASTLNIQNYKIENILNDKFTADLLSVFMEKNYYTFINPIDDNVPKNNKFFQYLSDYVQNGIVFKIPIKVIISRYIPKIVLKLIPRSIVPQQIKTTI